MGVREEVKKYLKRNRYRGWEIETIDWVVSRRITKEGEGGRRKEKEWTKKGIEEKRVREEKEEREEKREAKV